MRSSGTIKTAELTASFCLLERVIGPAMVHVDKGITDGLERASASSQEWEMLLSGSKNLVEVEQVKAHRTKKEKERHVAISEVRHRRQL